MHCHGDGYLSPHFHDLDSYSFVFLVILGLNYLRHDTR